MKNAIEMPSIINKMPSIIKKPSRYVMQRYREIINNSSSWTQVRDCFKGTSLLYVNTLLSKISFLSLAQSACSGTHVALPLNSAVCLRSEKCKYELCEIAITEKKQDEVAGTLFSGLGKDWEWQRTYLARNNLRFSTTGCNHCQRKSVHKFSCVWVLKPNPRQ